MPVNIFAEQKHNLLLQKNGYAIVPFLHADEIASLTRFFYDNHPSLPDGMYASSHAPDFSLRKKMNDEIQYVCSRAMKTTFQNVTPLGATFMVKSKGENGSLHPHQDWNIVDEEHFHSYNIWLPLVDVEEYNGTLLILPDSHTLMQNIRGLHIPSSFAAVQDELWSSLIPIRMKAGEALIYDHRLLHASGINHSQQPRLVIVYGLIPAEAEMRFYLGKENTIEEYACSPDFYFEANILNGPDNLPLLRSFVNNNPAFTLELLRAHYPKQQSVWQKLKSLWPFGKA